MKMNQCGGTRKIRKSRRKPTRKPTCKPTRKSKRNRWAYGGGKPLKPKAPNPTQQARIDAAKINVKKVDKKPNSDKQTKMFNDAKEKNKGKIDNKVKTDKVISSGSKPKLEAFSDYAGYHETDSRVPQETGAAIRDVTISPTNPIFSF